MRRLSAGIRWLVTQVESMTQVQAMTSRGTLETAIAALASSSQASSCSEFLILTALVLAVSRAVDSSIGSAICAPVAETATCPRKPRRASRAANDALQIRQADPPAAGGREQLLVGA